MQFLPLVAILAMTAQIAAAETHSSSSSSSSSSYLDSDGKAHYKSKSSDQKDNQPAQVKCEESHDPAVVREKQCQSAKEMEAFSEKMDHDMADMRAEMDAHFKDFDQKLGCL